MNKIVVVSLVANSEDIIESFVRHSLTFADEMLLIDHLSTDRTWEILCALKSEGLPITVAQYEEAELNHGAIMSRLMWQAFRERSADIVLPIDADEFLLTECPEKSCRQVLQQVRTDMVLMVHHWRYELVEPENDIDEFLLSRPSVRQHQPAKAMKVIMGKDAAQEYPFLAQGTHYAYRVQAGQEESAPSVHVDFLHLAHYQWRTYDQVVAKTINGWISNAAKYSVHTARCAYWKKQFDQLVQGERLELELPVEDREVCVPIAANAQMKLRYTQVSVNQPLQQLMHLSEQLAQQYSESHILERNQYISILIPFFGDWSELEHTLENVSSLQYPYQDRILIDFAGQKEKMQSFLECQADGICYVAGYSDDYVDSLQTAARGNYIQWLFPGIRLDADKLIKMLISLETDNKLTFVLSNARRIGWKKNSRYQLPIDIQQGREFFIAKGSYHGRNFLKSGRLLSGGLSALLLRRQTMEQCHWLSACIMNDHFLSLTALLQIFSLQEDSFVGVFDISLLEEKPRSLSLADQCWSGIEWLLQVEQRMDKLTKSDRMELRQNLMQRNAVFEQDSVLKTLPVYSHYKQLFKQIIEDI